MTRHILSCFAALLLCLEILAQPANNDCGGAITLALTCGGPPTTGNSSGATQSMPANCGGTADDDVWYAFVATGSTHRVSVTGSVSHNPVVEMFSGTCSGLTSLYCVNANGNGGTEIINAAGLTAGATYYVRVYHFAAGSGSGSFLIYVGSDQVIVGSGTGSNTASTYPTPYGPWNYDSRQQFLVRATELTAAGASAGSIKSLGFEVTNLNGAISMANYTIKIKSTSKTTLTAFENYGFTTVFGPVTYSPATGWNIHNFSPAFAWDGTSNIVIEICFDNPNTWSNNVSVRWTGAGYTCTVGNYTPASATWIVPEVCNVSWVEYTSTNRPNMRFSICPISTSVIDMMTVRIVSPPTFSDVGVSYPVTAEVKNSSTSGATITSATLNYQWNGGSTTSVSWTGSLAPGQSTTYTFPGSLTAGPIGFGTLNVWTSSPNGVNPDNNPSNDQQTAIIQVKDTTIVPSATTWSGTDFWWTMPTNASGSAADNFYYLDLLSPYCATVTIAMPVLGYSSTHSLVPFVTTTVSMPKTISGQTLYHNVNNAIQGKGIHITSDSAVTVYAIIYEGASVDAEAVMPTSTLGTSYVAQMRSPGYYDGLNDVFVLEPSLLTVVAKENGTDVKINTWNAAGTKISYTVTLNLGQTYRVSHNNPNCAFDNTTSWYTNCNTPSGATVMASKPIVCISHVACANMVPCGACDVLMVQHMPIENWGTTYLTAQAIDRGVPDVNTCVLGTEVWGVNNTADLLEIVGPIGTSVTISTLAGTTVRTIQAPHYGEYGYGSIWYENPKAGSLPTDPEFYGEANTTISASAPIQVIQYAKGYQYDMNTAGSNTDPEAIYLFPTSTWSDEYLVSTLNTLTAPITGLVVVAPSAATSSILVDGTNIGAVGWQNIASGTYRFRRVPVSAGPHVIECTTGAGVGVYLNAVGQAESYIAQGGHFPLVPEHICTLLELDEVVLSGEQVAGTHHLTWNGSNEPIRNWYTVERSNGTTDFTAIGEVHAQTGTLEASYSLDDHDPVSGWNYYRLRITNRDGSVDYSNVVKLERPLDIAVTMVPNPASDQVTITLSTKRHQVSPAELTVTNAFGQVVASWLVILHGGLETKELDVAGLASGLYYINVSGETVEQRLKLVVAR